ncbi:MAG: adenosylcobalamin-dependent ribonucleoside-diphosphate reductase [Methanoregula sp.]|jgi:ribonucleoside-diphosphate reductase alpha chain|nr:adenosylcobalamin-dependent ribonucleoside-diphosphate reductase [Methanoregula sp.]
MDLTPAAEALLAERYLLPQETPSGLFKRVAGAVDTPRSKEFLTLMKELYFIPNSPTLMNAATSTGQLSACFVLPVEDSLQEIFASLSAMALIHQSGGGTGFSFSRLRPSGDPVSSVSGTASGPLPFIRVFDEATTAVKQGGKRRGANMAVLACSHPDIMDFIHAKTGGGLSNFNLSAGFDAGFFRCLDHDRPYELVNPRDGSVTETIEARELWHALGSAAWQCGDPGALFLDTVNEKNTVPGLGEIEATNPCGEQPLLPYESCNLGSINLSRCVRKGELDEELLQTITRRGVQFLDAVIDANRFPLPEIKEKTLLTRKIGLGIMGLADALILMEIPYESDEALRFADRTMARISRQAKAASRELGEEKGSFPAIEQSIYSGAMRNATVTTIAPTGSLHIIAGTSSGIEPLFSLAGTRRIGSRQVTIIHPLLKKYLDTHHSGRDILAVVKRTGTLASAPVPETIKELYKTATEISSDHHVCMQAAVQKHVDNAVSKTVNLHEDAGVDEICRIFMLARTLGCKGVTVYRYNSRKDQVLSRGCEMCRVDV